MRKYVFLLTLVLLLTSGCGGSAEPRFTEEELALIPLAQRQDLPEVTGGFVLAIGDETITADEIIVPLMEHFKLLAQNNSFEQFKVRARAQLEQILVTKMSNVLLYQKAKRDAGEEIDERLERAVETEVRKFIASFGGDYAKAEKSLKEMGMDWNSFGEYQKKMILSQRYIALQLPENSPITYSELLERYNRMRDEFFATPETIKFWLIDIEPAKLQITEPNEDGTEQANELADELIGRIHNGEDFGELAKQYSSGHRRQFGGLWKPVQPDSLASPYDILAVKAEEMEPGEVVGPIVAGEHIFIMRLEEKQAGSVESLEEVQSQVEARIIFDRHRQAVDKLGAKLMQQVAIGNRDVFVDFCLREIYRRSNR